MTDDKSSWRFVGAVDGGRVAEDDEEETEGVGLRKDGGWRWDC